MQLLAGHQLAMSFITRQLFSQLEFQVDSAAKIGLVGMNGSGKTTLLRLIMGELQPDSGQITFSREARLAYMQQFLAADEQATLYDAALQVFAPLLAIEQELSQLNQALENEQSQEMLMRQQQLHERFEGAGGYTYQARLKSTLLGLGFSEADFCLPISALSGGQRSKAALAKVLLSGANLLLLDEPTNHLDIKSIEWLENFLNNYRGAFIVISHDRYFLDQVTNQTWALEHQQMRCFNCNYSAHLLQKAGEDESAARVYTNKMREIKRIEKIIEQQRRFNQARNYITIASKQKQIDRLKQGLVAPPKEERSLRFSFNTPPPGGNEVLELHHLAKGFGQKQLFSNVNLQINKGERIFLLGPNGIGKSTLMRIIIGQEQPDQGSMRLGVNILPVYYDQIQRHFASPKTILGYFTDKYPALTQTHIRTMLGNFLFVGEAVEKTIDTLSGGEKARLELLQLMLTPANFLLLDEPTNHLDIESREAVENALVDYPGSMLVISHDRYLINRLADRIYYLDEQGLSVSIGNYDDYLAREQNSQPTEPEPEPEQQTNEPAPSEQLSAGQQYKQRKEEQAEARRLKNKKTRLKEQIAEVEEQLDSISEQLAACAPADYLLLMELAQQQEQQEEQLLQLLTALDELRQPQQ